MRTLAPTLLMIMVLAASAPGVALPLRQNDAGTGGDAPGGPVGAPLLQPITPYLGFIDPPDDARDWYAFDAMAGDVLRFRSGADVQTCVRVRDPSGASLRGLCAGHTAEIDLSFRLPAEGRYHFEVYPSLPTDYWLSFTLNGGVPPAPPASSSLAGAGYDLDQDDAGSGRDAPDAPPGAPWIANGTLYEGNLTQPLGGPSIRGDVADTFAFHATAGVVLSLWYAGVGAVCYEILDPKGFRAASRCSHYAHALPSIEEITIALTGTHHLRFDTWLDRPVGSGPTRYHFAYELDGVPPTLLLPPPVPQRRPTAPPGAAGPYHSVIALIDDGINPYHEVFRDASPRARQHPSTYLPGFPADAEAIALSFDEPDLKKAVEKDCKEWEKVRSGQLYWFPGTRIVGAITLPTTVYSDAPLAYLIEPKKGPITCSDPSLKAFGNLVGSGGHGTMTASRAAAAGFGACPDCLIVMVQGLGAAHVRWAAEQPWIDMQSNSWGPITPAWIHADMGNLVAASPPLVRAAEEAARAMPSFWGAGNGAAFRLGVVGHPTQIVPHMGPSVIRVGATDSGRVALWGGSSPHVVSDACGSWAAEFLSSEGSGPAVGGGTSAATPFVAGTAARVLREARALLGDTATGVRSGGVLAEGTPVGSGLLADGILTKDELKRVLLTTADPRPERTPEDAAPCSTNLVYGPLPVEWSSVPEEAPMMQVSGYGAVTRATGDHALAVLAGAPMPERPTEDAWMATDDEIRRTTYPIWART